METHVAQAFGRMLSYYVEAMGMQAENKAREIAGLAPAYGESDFKYQANLIEETVRNI